MIEAIVHETEKGIVIDILSDDPKLSEKCRDGVTLRFASIPRVKTETTITSVSSPYIHVTLGKAEVSD